MATSIFLAKLIGFTYLVLAIAIFIRADEIQDMMKGLEKNKGMLFWGSALALVGGLAIVLVHNVWDSVWQAIITLFGWIAIVKGITLSIAPKAVIRSSKFLGSPTWTRLTAVVMILVSLYLLGYGMDVL